MFQKGHKHSKGKGKGKKSKSSKKKFTYPMPKNFKPFDGHLLVRTAKDGLLTNVEFVRFKGRPDNPKAKSVTLSQTDPATLSAIAARIGGTSFVTNPKKRLPPKCAFKITCRVGKNSEDNLRFAIREIVGKTSDGTKKKLSKKHPYYRRLRRCARTMPAAFMSIGEFPKPVKKGKSKDEDDE
jgi:hypothetical protein